MPCYKPSPFQIKDHRPSKGSSSKLLLPKCFFVKAKSIFSDTRVIYAFPFLITTENSSIEANFTLQFLKVTKLSYKH